MIKEAYCSFEIAKLLKDKGFNEGCSFVVNTISKGLMPVAWPTTNSDIEDEKANLIALPTHQMAMAWLRQVHNIFIQIGVSINLNGNYRFSYTILDKECKYVRIGWASFAWNYEEAVELALKYTLENLI